MLRLQRAQLRQQAAADPLAVVLQAVAVDRAQHRAAAGGADRVAAKRVEVRAARERGGDRGRRHDRRERQAVADALGHRDDVGHDALQLEAPERVAGAPEAGLHLVRDAEAARLAHEAVRLGQEAVGERRRAADALDRLGEKGGDAAGRRAADDVGDVLGVALMT